MKSIIGKRYLGPRTQGLHACIYAYNLNLTDKLLYMSGRDQRRVLFSLKVIFQNDKDLVHEFVHNGGLDALVKLGKNSDQNHQNHILRGTNKK